MKGLEYPLSLSGGNLKTTSSYPELVRNAILSGIYTQQTERVMRPYYGLVQPEFRPVEDVVMVLASIRSSIVNALENYPNVTYELRGSINDNGLYDVVVLYQVDDISSELKVTV